MFIQWPFYKAVIFYLIIKEKKLSSNQATSVKYNKPFFKKGENAYIFKKEEKINFCQNF